jgi:hypothetical protein
MDPSFANESFQNLKRLVHQSVKHTTEEMGDGEQFMKGTHAVCDRVRLGTTTQMLACRAS